MGSLYVVLGFMGLGKGLRELGNGPHASGNWPQDSCLEMCKCYLLSLMCAINSDCDMVKGSNC